MFEQIKDFVEKHKLLVFITVIILILVLYLYLTNEYIEFWYYFKNKIYYLEYETVPNYDFSY